jgi:hypothetical protein
LSGDGNVAPESGADPDVHAVKPTTVVISAANVTRVVKLDLSVMFWFSWVALVQGDRDAHAGTRRF